MTFRQPAIPPEQEGEMQERAWRRFRGMAAGLAERDREVAARERRVREEEEAVAQGAHRILPDPEGDSPSTNVDGRSPSGKRAMEEDEEVGQERGKRRRGEKRGAGEAEGAPRPASPSPQPTPTDWDSESSPPRQYAPLPVRRGPGTVAGWKAGEVAEVAFYVKWAGKTRGRRDKRGTRPFSDLVGRAGRPRERGPEMEEGRWRRMLGAALPGVRLDRPQEKGRKPRVQMLRELLQRKGRYGGDAEGWAGAGTGSARGRGPGACGGTGRWDAGRRTRGVGRGGGGCGGDVTDTRRGGRERRGAGAQGRAGTRLKVEGVW